MNRWDGIPYIDLTDVTIPPSVIDLVPESVARENTVLPLAYALASCIAAFGWQTDE